MMKKMWKRMLAMLLTVLMLGGAAPLGAMAPAITASAEDEKDSILEFLQDYFFPYLYLQLEFSHEFDVSASPDSRFLSYMLVESEWLDFYPLSGYSESSCKRVTYPGQSFKCYRVPAAPVDYVLKEVFNLSDSAIQSMRNNGADAFEQALQSQYFSDDYFYSEDAFSYLDGYYYYFSNALGVGGPLEYDWHIINVLNKGDYTYVKYSVEAYEEYGQGKEMWENKLYFAKLQKKMVSGKQYWSMWNHSATKLSDFPACYSCWDDAYYDFLVNRMYLSDEAKAYYVHRDYNVPIRGSLFVDALTQDAYDAGCTASLIDFDNNGLPELVVEMCSRMSAYYDSYGYNVYSFINGDFEYIGKVVGNWTSSFWKTNDTNYPGCFYYDGSYSYDLVKYVHIKDNKLEVIEVAKQYFQSDSVDRLTSDIGLFNCWKNKGWTNSYCPDIFIDEVDSMGWEGFLLNALDPTIYSKSLALYAADFCEAANSNNYDGIKAKYSERGFQDVEANNYSNVPVLGELFSASAYTLGCKEVDDTTLLCITLRGTTSAREAIGDGTHGGEVDFLDSKYKIYRNIYDYEEAVWSGLTTYVNSQSVKNKLDSASRITILVTGHSLGGAAASAVAARINYDIENKTGWLAKVSKNNVHAYTFGAIKVLPEDPEDITPNIEDGFENIHNIYNFYDKYGQFGSCNYQEVGSVYAKFGHTDLVDHYYDETNDDWANHGLPNYKNAIENGYITLCHSATNGEVKEFSQKFWDGGISGNVLLNFRQSWFANDSIHYNPELCIFTSKFAMLGYDQGDTNGNQNELRSGLEKCGFNDVETNNRTGEDEVNYFFAHKEIIVNGEKCTLLFAGLIGTYKAQWHSDFDCGTKDIHYGFNNAKNYIKQQLADYIKAHRIFANNNKIKVLLTGHSRGAATANLLAAEMIRSESLMIDKKLIFTINPKNIYTYTFATPNNAKDQEHAEDKETNDLYANKYLRIFNVINPEDFVTKCMPYLWGYGRYGRTFTLPSKTNTSNYKQYLTPMGHVYGQYRDVFGNQYNPYNDGEESVYKIIKEMTDTFPSVDDYYDEKYEVPFSNHSKMSFHSIIDSTLCNYLETDDVSYIADAIGVATYYGDCVKHFVDFFLSYGNSMIPGGDRFAEAHMAQTYCAYVTLLAYGLDSREFGSYKGIVNCPVDVEVRDNATGEVVGRIVNNTVDETIAAKDNAIVMTMNGDFKSFWLPGNGSYTVKLTGNDNGTMDYTLAEIDSDKGEVARVNFFDTKITKGKSWTGEAGGEDYDVETHTLKSDSGETKTPTETVDDTATRYTVTLNAEGDGYVTGGCTAVSGDCVTITAEPDEGRGFVGWYENGKLLSTDKEYAFVLKADRNITGRFAPKPTCSITSTHDVTASQTVTLSMTCDNGVAGYYWSTSPDCSDAVFNAVSGAPTTASVQKTVSRKGTYYLTAKDTKGAVSETVSITFCETVFENPIISEPDRIVLSERGSTFTVPECKTEDYRALSWGEDASIKPGDLYTVTENRTLFVYYAWHNSDTVYLVAYEPNGGSDEWYGELEYIGNPLRIIESIPNHKTLTFKEWNTQADGSGDGYRPGDLYSGNEDLTLYAVWKEKTPPVSLKINAPEKAYYKKPFVVSITTSQLPEGAQIKWTTNSNNAYASQGLDNRSFTLTPKDTGTFDLTVTIYSEDGEKLAEDSVNIVFTYAWWQWLIRIFLLGFIWY